MSEPPSEPYTGPPSYPSPPVYGPPPLGPSYAEPAFGPPAYAPSSYAPSSYAPSSYAPSSYAPSNQPPAAYPPTGYPPTGYPGPAYAPAGYQPGPYGPAPYPAAPLGWSQPPALPAPPTRSRRRRLIWIVAIGVAVVLIAGVVAAVVTNRSHGGGRSVATVNIPAGPGVEYRSSKAHFAARFPEPPDERTLPGPSGAPYIVYAVVDTASFTAVEVVLFDNGLPESEDDTLDELLTGGGSALGLNLSVSTKTTFHGHDAREATYNPGSGSPLSLLAFVYGGNRVYLLVAPTGSPFDNLKASFVAVP